MGLKSRSKHTPEHVARIQRKLKQREEESRLIRECRAGMTDPLATNMSFRRLTPEELVEREVAKREKLRSDAMHEGRHFGDPCEFCNLSFDEGDVRAAQPCPGIQPRELIEPLAVGMPYYPRLTGEL